MLQTIVTRLLVLFLCAPLWAQQQQIDETKVKNLVSDLAAKSSIVKVQQEGYTYAADTGAANAYAITLSPVPTIVAGSEIAFKAAHANTAASTVTVNGTSYPLTKNGATALASGDIPLNGMMTAKFDGTNFQLSQGLTGATGATGSAGATGATGPAGTSSVTTKGDLQGFSTVAARVPVGADGQVLMADSTQATGVKYASGGIVAGTNVNVTGSWPNQTVSAFGGSSAVGGPVQVQLVSQSPASGPMTFTSPNTLGNTIVVFFTWFVASGLPTITDSRGNSYVSYDGQSGVGGSLYGGFAIATNCAAGANTVSFSTGAGDGIWLAVEFSGVTGIEASQPIANGNVAGPLSVGPITTTAANTLILLYSATQNGGGSMTNSGGWSSIYNGNDTHNVTAGLFSFVASAAGTYSNTVQISGTGGPSTNKMAGMLGLKGTPSGVGTVTSVGLSVPSRQTVSGSPVTGSGTFVVTDNAQAPNLVFAGPASGAAAAPTFRALVAADIPGGGGTSPLTTKGDIFGYSTAAARIPVGADTNVLTADSTQAAGVKWAANPAGFANPMTTAGDIINGGSGGTPQRLGIGSNGQVLTLVSGAPAWAASGGGGSGALTLLNTLTASSSAALIDTTSITATYDDYLLEFVSLVGATAGGVIYLRFSSDGGATYDAASHYIDSSWRWNSGGGGGSGGATTQLNLSSGADPLSTNASYGLTGPCRLYQPASTTPFPKIVASLMYMTSTPLFQGIETRGVYTGGSAINAFQIKSSVGNLASGIVRIYGVSK